MTEAGGSWGVEYADGSQYFRFADDGTENAWNAIHWPDVVSVAFASPDAEATFPFEHPGPPWAVRMGSRVSTAYQDGSSVEVAPGAVRCFMIVTHVAGEAIRPDTVARVFFWMPDGSIHDCDDLNCPQVAAYMHSLVHGHARPAMAQAHSRLNAAASAVLE